VLPEIPSQTLPGVRRETGGFCSPWSGVESWAGSGEEQGGEVRMGLRAGRGGIAAGEVRVEPFRLSADLG